MNNNEYNYFDIQRYLHGKMSAIEMHNIEKAALTDPFLNEAIEGYKKMKRSHLSEIEQINTSIFNKIAENSHFLQKNTKKPLFNRIKYASIAAAAIAGIGLFSYLKHNYQPENTVLSKVNVAENDSNNIIAQSAVPNNGINKIDNQSITLNESTEHAKKTKLATQLNDALPKMKPNEDSPIAVTALNEQNEVANLENLNQKEITSKNNTNKEELDVLNKKLAFKNTYTKNELYIGSVNSSPTIAQNKSLNKQLSSIFESAIPKFELNNTSVEPIGGWNVFVENLQFRLGKTEEATNSYVRIKFKIDKGEADNFEIINSSDPLIANKTIDIIKTGPKWLSNKKDKMADLTIQFN